MHVYGMMHAERTRAGDSVFLISYPLIISNLVPRYGNYRGIRYSYCVASGEGMQSVTGDRNSVPADRISGLVKDEPTTLARARRARPALSGRQSDSERPGASAGSELYETDCRNH